MKKIIVIVFLIIGACQTNSQTSNESVTNISSTLINYSAPFIVAKFQTDTIVYLEEPLGKDVKITYDTFFKSLVIGYTNEEDDWETMKLKHIRDLEGDYSRVKETYAGTMMTVRNQLDKLGMLDIMTDVNENNQRGVFTIVDATKDD